MVRRLSLILLAIVLCGAAGLQLWAEAAHGRPSAFYTPWDSELDRRVVEAALAAVESAHVAEDAAMLRDALVRARTVIAAALTRRPDDAELWLLHAGVLALSGASAAIWEASLRRSYETGPREGRVTVRRLPFALAHLAELPPATAAHVMRELDAMVGWRSAFLSQFANAYARSGLEARFAVQRALARQEPSVRARVNTILAGADARSANRKAGANR